MRAACAKALQKKKKKKQAWGVQGMKKAKFSPKGQDERKSGTN